MVAAGIAGFWAVLSELVIHNSNTDFRSLGSSCLIIATALVLAYILKDRIKELGKNQFKRGLLGTVPYNQSSLLYNLGTSFKKPANVGTYAERQAIIVQRSFLKI